jgi:hypothetical protein
LQNITTKSADSGTISGVPRARSVFRKLTKSEDNIFNIENAKVQLKNSPEDSDFSVVIDGNTLEIALKNN